MMMMRAIVIRPLRSAIIVHAQSSSGAGLTIRHPPPPTRRLSITTSTTTIATTAATMTPILGPIERTPPPPSLSQSKSSMTSSSSCIFPMHVLGCGPIGLLYASAMLDAQAHDVDRRHNHRDSNDDDVVDEAGVTLILRPHHESRLGWSTRRSGHDAGVVVQPHDDDADDDDDDSTAIRRGGSPRRCARVVVRRPPSPSSSAMTDDRQRRDDVIGDVVSRHRITVELTNEKDDAGPIKCLLLCTKANDAIEAVSGVWDRLSTKGSRSCDDGDGSTSTLSSSTHDATGKVIVLSNGALAIRDAMYDRFGRRSHDDIDNEYCGMGPGGMERSLTLGGVRIILGTTTHGAYRTRSTRSTVGTMYDDDDDADFVTHYDIVHAGIGTTTCADREFVDACTSIGWDARYVSLHAEMDAILWRKLAANCVINPLTAIHGMRNGDLLNVMMGRSRGGRIDDDADSIRTIAFGILKEVSAVATREMAYHTSTANILSVPLLEDYVLGVMSATRDNVSSMLQDVEAGRTTEVRYLNGYVSRLGRERHGIECSINFEMCRLVEEMNYSSRRVNLHT